MGITRLPALVPIPLDGTFDRPRLVELLTTGPSSKLRVVIAPTGWGKSQLVARWLSTRQTPIAFMGLDANDNDPSRCWTHLLSAISNGQNPDRTRPCRSLG